MIIPETTNCRVPRVAKLTQDRGFLSNLITAETGCGSVVSPWLIEAKSGQRVNVTLWNFAMEKAGDLAQSLGANSCLKYATLTETGDKKHHKVVCGDFARTSHVYTSVGSSLDVRFQGLPSSSSAGPYFLLEYQSRLCSIPITEHRPNYGCTCFFLLERICSLPLEQMLESNVVLL